MPEKLGRPYNHGVREPGIEGHRVFDLLHMLLGESDVEGLDVPEKMFDLPSADYGKYVRRLLHQVRDRNCP